MLNFGSTIATRLTLALLLQFAMSSAMAGDTCDGDLSNWPSDLDYIPSSSQGEGALLRLGPMTISGLVAQAGSVVVSGQVITISGWWEDACGFHPHAPHYSNVEFPNLAPGVYTVNFDVVVFPGADQFTRTLVIGGGNAPERHIVPAVSGYSLAAGILAMLGLVGWQLRHGRLRTRLQGS